MLWQKLKEAVIKLNETASFPMMSCRLMNHIINGRFN